MILVAVGRFAGVSAMRLKPSPYLSVNLEVR